MTECLLSGCVLGEESQAGLRGTVEGEPEEKVVNEFRTASRSTENTYTLESERCLPRRYAVGVLLRNVEKNPNQEGNNPVKKCPKGLTLQGRKRVTKMHNQTYTTRTH